MVQGTLFETKRKSRIDEEKLRFIRQKMPTMQSRRGQEKYRQYTDGGWSKHIGSPSVVWAWDTHKVNLKTFIFVTNVLGFKTCPVAP